MTLAATIDEFVYQQQWMDRHGGRESLGYWDEEGVCISRRSHQGAEGKVLPWGLNVVNAMVSMYVP
jgi:hypothetical protein